MEPPEGDAFGPLLPPPLGVTVPQPPLPPAVAAQLPSSPYTAYAPYDPYAPYSRYGSPAYAPVPMLPPVSKAVLDIPLGTGELVRQALDLLTRSDSGLRGPSFYIGLLLLIALGPLAVIAGMVLALGQGLQPTPAASSGPPPAWAAWLFLASVPGLAGLVAASAEASALATAVIGGRVEGRPLRIRESIAIARRRFWSILGPRLLVSLVSGVINVAMTIVLFLVLGLAAGDLVATGAGLVISLVVSAPFVYVPAGVVLGEVGAGEAISRSFRLVMLRKRLAIVITLFGVFSQFIVTFGLSAGIDAIGRVLIGAGLVDSFPTVLVVPIAAALVFALGTLTFLVEAIAAAPAVHAFAALTHYTHGLDVGRREPVRGRHLWDPWVTPGLALVAVLGLLILFGAIASFPA